MNIVKKDGRIEKFNIRKVKTSIENAARDSGTMVNESDLNILVNDVEKVLLKVRKDSLVTSSYEVIGTIFEILKRDSLNGKVEGYLYTKNDNVIGPIPELIGENKRVWMRLSPKEIEGSYEFIKFATGKVGVVGLGLGYVAQ